MSANCDVIIIFPISGHYGTIWKLDSRHIAKNAVLQKKMLASAKLRGPWY